MKTFTNVLATLVLIFSTQVTLAEYARVDVTNLELDDASLIVKVFNEEVSKEGSPLNVELKDLVVAHDGYCCESPLTLLDRPISSDNIIKISRGSGRYSSYSNYLIRIDQEEDMYSAAVWTTPIRYYSVLIETDYGPEDQSSTVVVIQERVNVEITKFE